MDGRAIGLFIHIAGAIGFFAALGLEWTGLGQIRSATSPELVRAWMRIFRNARTVESVSMLAIVLTGVYPMVTEWGGVPWIIVSLGSFALMIALSVVLSRPRMALIERVLATEQRPTSQTFHNLASHPRLWISIQTQVAIGLGILLLMLAKPDYVGSLLIIGIAIVLGVVSAFPALRKARALEWSARMTNALFVIVFVAALALLAENSISASTISSTATAVPDGPSILQNRCTQCHSLTPIQRVKRTRVEWENVLSTMESLDVKITDSEKMILLDYLTSADRP